MQFTTAIACAVLATINGQVVTQTTSINLNELVGKVDKLVDETVPAAIADAKVNTMKASYEASVNATMQSYNSMLEQNKRIDSLMSTIAQLTGTTVALEAKLAAVEAGIDASETKLTNDINNLAEESIENTESKIDGAVEDLTKRAAATEAAAKKAGGSSHYYVHWGSKSCKKISTSTKLKTPVKGYNGWAFGTQHNNAGGGNENLCLIDASGNQGGQNSGGWHDGVRPLRIEGTGQTSIRGVESRIVPCATCMLEQHCYDEVGLDGCKMEGYSPMYKGWMFGAYHGHHGNNERICIEKTIDANGDWDNRGYYVGHIYPTQTQDGTGKRSGGTKSLSCAKCCKNAE